MSVPLSILYLLIINLMEFLKVWAKHNFYYIRYISVYIQPRYFYLIFRSVNGNNMNRVILHSVRPSFWKKRAFSHAPRCGSTESGCEISVPWWLILADLGKMTSVWSRDRDTGDTSECIPQIMILFFSEFLDFSKYFFLIFLWNRLKPFCIPKHMLKDDWMFLQHWAICWCRRPSVGQTISVAGVSLHVLTIRHQSDTN